MNFFWRLPALLLLVFSGQALSADLLISEVFFNPPGTDTPLEYIEFRGVPNSIIATGTWLISVEGDAESNPGTIQNVFDLSGLRLGGNGFLALGQKGNVYGPDPTCDWLVHTNNGGGWGSGLSSSVRHTGNTGVTELKNSSVTFLVISATTPPNPGVDLDINDDGAPDAPWFNDWTIHDSIGVLDADGLGDFAYGALNFRRANAPGNTAGALGRVVSIDFTPRYVARAGNTSGSGPLDWVAGDAIGGTAPTFSLGPSTSTYPTSFAGYGLTNIGGPNFGASPLPGLIVSNIVTTFMEGETGAVYTVRLNTQPAGAVSVSIGCPPGIEVSVDEPPRFGPQQTIVLTNKSPRTVALRSPSDNVVGLGVRRLSLTNSVSATKDAAQYPLTASVPEVRVGIVERGALLLNELKVNPVGTNDGPYEYIELRGSPGMLLSNVLLLAIEGNSGNGPGRVTWRADLTGNLISSNGFVLVVPTNTPYSIPANTTCVYDAQMAEPGGALANGSATFALVTTTAPIQVGDDLDRGNDGELEGLPADATVLDSVAWKDSDGNDLVYGEAVLNLPHAAPDAATRLPWNDTPRSALAWIWGDLGPGEGQTLAYGFDLLSAGFPVGTILSPGGTNDTAPTAVGLAPVSGVIGDANNPVVSFQVKDDRINASDISVAATSSNPAVVPDSNLAVTSLDGGNRVLRITPVGVGYAELTLWLSEGNQTGRVTLAYAASAPGRPGGAWHAGASDASTAIPLDQQYMFVGDDENQILRLYDRRRSGLPIAQYDMTQFLQLPDAESGLPREVDVEASTRVGNRLFWIGSLGHAAIGESRTNRTRVFATDIRGSGPTAELTYSGRYDYLKVDLIAWDAENLHGKGTNYYGFEASDAEGVPPKATDGSGFAIEGLCMMPGSTSGAFIGFRAPIIPATNRTFALIVPVLNFASLAVSGGPPRSAVFGPPIELDLYDRGIRSIEGDTNGYVIIAGPPGGKTGPYPQDFRLYTWTGLALNQPQQRSADLADLNPEAIVELPTGPWDPSARLQLLSDGGATVYYGDDVQAKFLRVPNFKKFRSDWVPIGSVEQPAPYITGLRVSDPALVIRWRACKGNTYRIERTDELGTSASWQPVPGLVMALGPFAEKTVPTPRPTSFFRVVLVENP